MNTCKAKGILAHHFHGSYWCQIALEFESSAHALLALPELKDDWKVADKEPSVLVWAGDSASLEACKQLLGSFGADVNKIDSLKTSVDHGEPFKVEIPTPNRDQLPLFSED